MKKAMRRTKRRVLRFIDNLSWDRIIRVLGGVTAVAGFFVMLGSAGASDLNTKPLNECILISVIGLSMLVVGSYVARLFDFQQPNEYDDEEDDPLPDSTEGLIGAMAWNSKYRSWMVLVDYKNDENWVFALCDRKGRPKSVPMRTYNNILNYKWTM